MSALPVPLRRVAVFCGSAPGADPRFLVGARALGAELASAGIGVVYGGAMVGCMGAVADGALSAGGEVIGVLTRGLERREIAHRGLTRLELVDTMHERKARMAALSDAVIVLPGGYGTLDELFEALTWSQLRIDRKPIGLLDAHGFWEPLLAMLDAAVDAGFIHPGNRALLASGRSATALLAQFAAADPER
ncbi:MAG: TIGR00730 family Rossman fold protein [Gemmatimonadaceae bacterium]|nr:TIGR00730 family Rossman fold protein [Gemmatimonadaceae bacterium]